MGANLEVFKFSVYLFIPLFAMIHFGDPDWYEHHVYPMKKRLWPVPYEETNKPPHTSAELHSELERLRAQRLGLPATPASSAPVAPAIAPATPSGVLSSLPDRRDFSWANGDKRLV